MAEILNHNTCEHSSCFMLETHELGYHYYDVRNCSQAIDEVVLDAVALYNIYWTYIGTSNLRSVNLIPKFWTILGFVR